MSPRSLSFIPSPARSSVKYYWPLQGKFRLMRASKPALGRALLSSFASALARSFRPVFCPVFCLGFCLALFFLAFSWPSATHAEDIQAKTSGAKFAHAKFMGVASCSSSNCHGATAPRSAANVLQNEYTTWAKHDAHAKAWLSLTGEDSKKIASHLGIQNPEKEPWCLSCHATIAPQASQGEKFRTEDGVGCETCHGAGEHYLSPHAEDGATHARNLELGMTDLVSPEARAPLCLSCHFGNEEKTVDHRLIGAGHPRLTFELDTFSALEPAHWDVDDDYKKRKQDYSSAQAWLSGQATRAKEILAAFQSPKRSRAGSGLLAGPELTLLYCYTCHHSLSEEQWKNRDYLGRPGELRLNLSSLEILSRALTDIDSALAQKISDDLNSLHSQGDASSIAKRLDSALSQTITLLRTRSFDKVLVGKLMKTLARYGAESPNPPFEVAEQVAMGLSSLASSVSVDGSYHKREIDQVYSSLSSPATFQPDLYNNACAALLKQL